MFISIMAIIISAIYGSLGYLFTDSVQVLNYALSEQNLLNDDPIIFTKKNDFLSEIIIECADGDGHLFDIISQEITSWDYSLQSILEEQLKQINESCIYEVKGIISDYYQTMINNTYILLSSTGELFNISRAFAKNDKNIILNEIRSAGKRATVISS